MNDHNENLVGNLIKQRRLLVPLTLQELAANSGVSSSHLGRIERGERRPTAQTLRKLAKPLGLTEVELFVSAGYLPPQSTVAEGGMKSNAPGLDPYVANVLSQEPVGVQRTVVAILIILKTIAEKGKRVNEDKDKGF